MIVCGILALAWIIYATMRKSRISSALLRDQIGMASAILATLAFVSNFSGLFGD
jgi:hypothetical protein